MIGTITMNPSIDQNLIVKELIKDDANRALSMESHAGGKGANVSKVIRELGGKTHAYSLSGGFAGGFWEKRLQALDISYSVLRVEGETRTNTIITDIDDKTQTRFSAPGPVVSAIDVKKFVHKLVCARPKPCLWALGGSLSRGMPHTTYRHLVTVLQKLGTPCILDADNEALEKGIQAKPFMIKPNEHEIERLMRRKFTDLKEYEKAARDLNHRGVEIVIVSLGERGAIFVRKKTSFYIPGIKVPVKSKVGAGDSLIGGMALGLAKGWSLERAAALGVAASASAVMREAPRLCLRSDIPKLLKRIVIKRLN
jgi:1-phosphofructokinase